MPPDYGKVLHIDRNIAEAKELLNEAGGVLKAGKRREAMPKMSEMPRHDRPIAQPVFVESFTFMDNKASGFSIHRTNAVFGSGLSLAA